MQRPYGLGQETSTLEHQAQESVAECGDNCICVQLDGFDITLTLTVIAENNKPHTPHPTPHTQHPTPNTHLRIMNIT